MDIEQLSREQLKMAASIITKGDAASYFPKLKDLLFTFDVQYEKAKAFVAIDVQEWQGEVLGTFLQEFEIPSEYIPSFFAFREGPLLLKAMNQLEQQKTLKANLLIVDGHGVAHPRKLGVASWLGLQANLPSIGCAKQTLLKFEGDIATPKGSTLDIKLNEQTVGCALRTQANVKPVFVSCGHKITLPNCIEIVQTLASRYRIVESIRRADQAARAFAKGALKAGWNLPMKIG